MLLSLEDLKISFRVNGGITKEALRGVSFSVFEGEIYCLLGESGSGKSVLLKSILGLLPPNAEVSGRVIFDGKNLLELSQKELSRFRGSRISMIFQEPMTALNPTMKVGEQVAEVLRFHFGLSTKEAEKKVVALLAELGIPEPEHRYHQYPHNFSGGMRQRIVIAMAVVANPELILADEPTTALDVTVQSQILHLLKVLVARRGASMIFVTHDFSVVAEIGDRVGVMYRGVLVEEGRVEEVLRFPKHPYTKALIEAIPVPGRPLVSFSVPKENVPTEGCPYVVRCPVKIGKCFESMPDFVYVDSTHRVRCFNIDNFS